MIYLEPDRDDRDDRAAVIRAEAAWLAEVSPAMIEAASRELTRIELCAPITEAQRFETIWRSMLAAKLGGRD